jgi:AraC-like DNA-binding protein
VSATVLPVATRALLDACARLGLDPGALAARAGVDPARLDDPDVRLPAEAADAVWREASAAAHDPALALHAAERTPFGAFRVLDFLGATGATIGAGLERVAAYFPLVDPRGTVAVEPERGAIALVFRGAGGDLPPQAQEYTLAILASRVRHGAATPPTLAVRFTFARPAHAAEHARVLGVEPAYGAREAALVVGQATWDAAPRAADPGLFAALDAHARALAGRAGRDEGTAARVRGAVAEELPGREPSLGRVARRLGTSPRTLQRRLAGEGTTFAEVADAVRRERAEAFLSAADVSIAEVSWLSGFAEQSAFARAFRRWTGVAPKRWRSERAALPVPRAP